MCVCIACSYKWHISVLKKETRPVIQISKEHRWCLPTCACVHMSAPPFLSLHTQASRAGSKHMTSYSSNNFLIYFVPVPFPGSMMAVLNVWMFILITLNSWKWASGCTWMKTHNEAFLSNFQVLSKNSIVHLQHAVSTMRDSICRWYKEYRGQAQSVLRWSVFCGLYCFSAEVWCMTMDIWTWSSQTHCTTSSLNYR